MMKIFNRKWLGIIGVVLIVVLATGVGISQTTPDSRTSSTIGADLTILTIGHVAYAAGDLDYECDGEDDDIQWQQLLDALPASGGKVVALTFNYSFSTGVTRAIDNVTIQGLGRSSYIALDGSNPVITAGGDNWVFKDFRTDAGGIDTSGTTGWVKENILEGSTYYALQTTENIVVGDIDLTGTMTRDPIFQFSDLSHGEYFAAPWHTINATVGENVSAGELVFMASDSKLWLTDADYSANMTADYLAVETIEADSSGILIKEGYWRDTGKSETPGADAYASTTPGAISTTPPAGTGDQVQKVGKYETSDILYADLDRTKVEID